MKIVFMGTPDFARGALEALLGAGHEILAVVTQPDRARGRSGRLQPSPVKECALAAGIPVLQPERIKRPEAVAELKKYEADLFVVAAFGQILSQEILDLPRLGCLNIHASLLPKYRGASPIQHVLLDGEEKTGITVMQMNAGLDTGDIIYQKEIPIEGTDTFETLHDKLMVLGGEAIVEALPLLEAGKLVPVPQREEESCYASLISKEMGELDFQAFGTELERKVRALNPWPGAYTFFRGKQLKIWKAALAGGEAGAAAEGTAAKAAAGAETEGTAAKTAAGTETAVEAETEGTAEEGAAAETTAATEEGNLGGTFLPGQVEAVDKDSLTVRTGAGSLRILELQLEGKKRMSAHDFLLGMKVAPGERLGR